MTQVELPWMPILCSIEPQVTPLRSASGSMTALVTWSAARDRGDGTARDQNDNSNNIGRFFTDAEAPGIG